MTYLSAIHYTQRTLYTETIDGYTWFWPTSARVGNYTRVPENREIEQRAEFARMGYRFEPIAEARKKILPIC